MPALTNLRLIKSIPDDSELNSSTYPVVDLPCLRVLCISSYVGVVTTVLRHITIPHNAILNLTCRDKQYTQIDFSKILSVKILSSLRSSCHIWSSEALACRFWKTHSKTATVLNSSYRQLQSFKTHLPYFLNLKYYYS